MIQATQQEVAFAKTRKKAFFFVGMQDKVRTLLEKVCCKRTTKSRMLPTQKLAMVLTNFFQTVFGEIVVLCMKSGGLIVQMSYSCL